MKFIQILTQLWSTVAVKRRSRSRSQGVIIHDPAAQNAQDLDDPFLNPEAQARIGRIIGNQSKRVTSKTESALVKKIRTGGNP
jgi:hypothetical protein